MMKKIFLCMTALLLLGATGVSHAVPVYVEGINDTAAFEDNNWWYGGGYEFTWQYIPSVSYDLTMVEFYLYGGNDPGQLTIRFREDDASSPGDPGAVLGETTFGLSSTYEFQGTEFSAPVELIAGNTYWVGFSSTNGVGSYRVGDPVPWRDNTRGYWRHKLGKKGTPGIMFFEDDAPAGAPIPNPEPATMLLLGSGLVGLAGFRRRFKKA